MSIITIIPARKSSRRLKNKNILKIKGMSLVDRVLNDSKKIKFTSKIILTTDIGSEYLLLYKNFDTRDEAINHCHTYLFQLDKCLIVNTKLFNN